MKFLFLKYMDKIIYISLFIIINIIMNMMPPENFDGDILVLRFTLFPVLSVMILVLMVMIQMLPLISSDEDYEIPITFFLKKKEFFEYKESVYFTKIGEYNRNVYIYKSIFFVYKEVGSIEDSDDVNAYKEELKNVIDNYIIKDLNKKIKKRRLKYKFNEFNKI